MDIQKITSDLIATGLTQQELANLVPCSQSSINAFLQGKRGSRPSLAIGNRLMELFKERCEKSTGRRNSDVVPPPGHRGRQAENPKPLTDCGQPEHVTIFGADK